jgi:DNA-binding IclR family transcriptional regulator
MAKPKSDYSIQTVTNALRLLESFFDEDELGVSELSRRLGLHKNNVFRLLATLEQSGYIEQSSRSERYRLGASCLELGCAFSRSHGLLSCARPLLEDLSQQLQEAAHLAVLRDFEVVHMLGVQPTQLLGSISRVGMRLPLHASALGKVLLGCGDDALRELYDQTIQARSGFQARTPATITDGSKFFEHLRTVAVQGFAVDLEEYEPGLHCVAAPVWDANGGLLAAISVSGPAFRMPEDLLYRETVARVTDAASELSRQLGHAV